MILLVLSILPQKAEAKEVSRAALMDLARDFVNRVGQKLQGDTPEEDALKQIPENELLLLQPRIARKILIDSTIGAMRRQDQTFVSFREFCQGLEFPLQVDTEKLSAQGWFIKESNIFTMDLSQGFVQVAGTRMDVDPSEWFRQDGEIFIATEAIFRWMGIEALIESEVLLLELESIDPFPVEERIARRKTRLGEDDRPTEPQLPRADNPYRIASVPVADVSLAFTVRKESGEMARTTSTQSILTSGDLFGLNTNTFTTMDRDKGITAFRFDAGQKSETDDLLGPLRAREFRFGDVIPTDLSGTGNAEQSIGMRITNSAEGEIAGTTTRTFEGDVPPDWDVELYDGAQLIAFQTVGATGRYKFSGVDLFAGENDFRLVFYGPQGEVREETVSIPIDLADVGADKRLYDVSLTLNNVNTYSLVPPEDDDEGTPHLVVSYEQGIHDGLSANAGFRTQQTNGLRKALAKGGIVARVGQTLFNADIVADEELETSFLTVARRAFGEHDVRISNFLATSGFDPDNSTDDPIVLRNQINVRGPILKWDNREITYSLASTVNELAGGTNNMNVNFSQNMRLGRFTLGHALTFSRSLNEDGQNQSFNSLFSARSSIGQTRIRASAGFDYEPAARWSGVNLVINRYLSKTVQVELELDQDLNPNKTEATARLNWNNDHFVLSPRITYNSNQELVAGVNMRFGLAYDEFSRSVTMTRQSMGGKGAVHAFVYLDRDGNRKFDGKDEPLPDVKVMGVQIPRSEKTDQDGVAFIHDFPEYEATDVVVDQSTLGDPYYVVGFEGLSIYPRAGVPVKIEFPVHLSGELDGSVFKPGPKGLQAASGLRLQLFDTKGQAVMSTLSAFDGYYVASVIPPGDYLLMVNPDDLQGTGLRQPWPRKIHIGYDGQVLAGQDIYLERGHEVPVRFVAKGKEKEEPMAKTTGGIEIQMGAYRSSLLTQVMKLRIRKALFTAGIDSVGLETRDTQQDGRAMEEIVTTVPSSHMNEARQICDALVRERLACAMMLPPKLLLDQEQAQGDAPKKEIKG